jgi:hypothetical protein
MYIITMHLRCVGWFNDLLAIYPGSDLFWSSKCFARDFSIATVYTADFCKIIGSLSTYQMVHPIQKYCFELQRH